VKNAGAPGSGEFQALTSFVDLRAPRGSKTYRFCGSSCKRQLIPARFWTCTFAVEPGAFQQRSGPTVAFNTRRKSFQQPRNSYNAGKFLSLCFVSLADGMPHALANTDEVARNGVLQRITSARGFLWAPLAFSPERTSYSALPLFISSLIL